MGYFRHCVAIINTRSGAREGLSVFASALQQYLDKAGITHHDIRVPEKNILWAMDSHLNIADAIVVVGGDGTVSSVVNLLAATRNEAFLQLPIILVPCGLQNSIALSLGIFSAERSVSAFVVGRVESIPIWEVCVNGRLTRYITSYLSIGAYAMCVQRLHDLGAVGDNYVVAPMVRGKFKLGAFYTALRSKAIPCTTLMSVGRSRVELRAPMKLLIASQMPLQHSRYTLTPRATFKQGTLSVTYATEEATRLRLWHLLSREAAEGIIISEDGVSEFTSVSELDIVIGDTLCKGEDNRCQSVLMMLDGEAVCLSPGARVTVRKAPCQLLFASC